MEEFSKVVAQGEVKYLNKLSYWHNSGGKKQNLVYVTH